MGTNSRSDGRSPSSEHPPTATRPCSRCRQQFAVADGARHRQLTEWWLCPGCHEKLIGSTSKAKR